MTRFSVITTKGNQFGPRRVLVRDGQLTDVGLVVELLDEIKTKNPCTFGMPLSDEVRLILKFELGLSGMGLTPEEVTRAIDLLMEIPNYDEV